MARKLLKCYGTCEKKYQKDELHSYKSKNYCTPCLRAKGIDLNGKVPCEKCGDEIKYKLLEKTKDGLWCFDCVRGVVKKKEKVKDEMSELHHYISELFKIPFPTVLMKKQIKDYIEVNGYSIENIKKTIFYVYEIKGTEKLIQHGIGIVPYFYDEMLIYNEGVYEKRKQMENYVIPKDAVVVRISKPVIDDSYRKKKLIDMESLLK